MALVIVAAAWAAMHFIDPAPPMDLVMATGAEDSEYIDFAHNYAEELAQDGVKLNVQSAGGALEKQQQIVEQRVVVALNSLNAG